LLHETTALDPVKCQFFMYVSFLDQTLQPFKAS